MALKACSATQITALLNYNFVGSGSILYPRHSEVSLTDLSCQARRIYHLENYVEQTANIQVFFVVVFLQRHMSKAGPGQDSASHLL